MCGLIKSQKYTGLPGLKLGSIQVRKDYLCFREALLLIKEKKHLTREGLDKIKSLNLEMNSNRLK
jgi:hypothetical protein